MRVCLVLMLLCFFSCFCSFFCIFPSLFSFICCCVFSMAIFSALVYKEGDLILLKLFCFICVDFVVTSLFFFVFFSPFPSFFFSFIFLCVFSLYLFFSFSSVFINLLLPFFSSIFDINIFSSIYKFCGGRLRLSLAYIICFFSSFLLCVLSLSFACPFLSYFDLFC